MQVRLHTITATEAPCDTIKNTNEITNEKEKQTNKQTDHTKEKNSLLVVALSS